MRFKCKIGPYFSFFVNFGFFEFISSFLALWADLFNQIRKYVRVFLMIPEFDASFWRKVFVFKIVNINPILAVFIKVF